MIFGRSLALSLTLLVAACSSTTTEVSDSGAGADGSPATPPPPPPNDGGATDDGSPSGGDAAPGDARLSQIQASIFTRSCATAKCHSGTLPKGNLSLEDGKSYAQLVGVKSATNAGQIRVVAGDASKSLLALCLKGAVGRVGRMPDNASALPASDIATIEAWINAGAKND